MLNYSWVSGEAPELEWPQFTDLTNDEAWSWLVQHYCIINENHEIRFMSIFDLLNPQSNLKFQSGYEY